MFKLTVAFVVIACFALTAEAYRLSGPHGRVPNPRFRDPAVERFFQDVLETRSCVALGGTGCESNHGKCCRKGNPHTGTMRKCINVGDYEKAVYKCVEP